MRRLFNGKEERKRYIDGRLESGDWVSSVFEGVSQVLVFGWDFSVVTAVGNIQN